MKIQVRTSGRRELTFVFPTFFVFNRFFAGSIAKSIAKSGGMITIDLTGSDEKEKSRQPKEKPSRESVKRLKRALIPAFRELKRFKKRNPGFVFIEVESEDGEGVVITL